MLTVDIDVCSEGDVLTADIDVCSEVDVLTADIDVCSEVEAYKGKARDKKCTLVTMFKSRFDVK